MSRSSPELSVAEVSRRTMRRVALSQREALTETARLALTSRICLHLSDLLGAMGPALLGFCWPYRGEPDLQDWVRHWLAGAPGRSAALPVVLDREKPLAFRIWTPGMALVADRHGIPHPPHGEAVTPDVVLVPLNAFDARGYRLGYGGGYFDRTLAAIAPLAVGVGIELGRTESVHPQAHDRPMDWIVTEAGAFRCR